MTPALVYTARSHLGMVRENNEDSAYAGPRLLALADGMGGHAAGEIASQFVVAALARLDEDEPGQNLTAALTRALTVGNEAIAAHVESHPETEGMGCTATALLFDGRRMGLIHVGDSRAYLLRDGALSQITKDDTFVQSLVDRGELSADEAHTHPRRSLILKALTGEPVEPTAVIREARVGDRYLLCSDGLSDPVSTETIAETLSTGTVEEAADRLVQLALRSGGPDNITVVLADVVDSPRDAPVVPVVVGAASGDEPGQIDPAADPYSDTAAGKAAAFSRAQVASRAGEVVSGAGRGAAGPGPGGDDDEGDPAPPRGSRWRFALSVVGVLAVLAGIVGVSALLVRSNYFVTEEDNQVVVKRGISGEAFGISLASVSQVACLASDGDLTMHSPDAIPTGCDVFTLGDLREPARETVRAGMPSGSLAEATAQVSRLAQDNLLPVCEPEPRDPDRDGRTSPSSPSSPTGPAPVPGETCRAVS
ncbi:serine/threonine-protein phosphatase [Dietzia cinnamea]|uniref:PP2C family protein-serine/threonine phosphatase n=1 Tax=Dietzia cinnamea TaxID=321318 RepID=UPI000D620FF8|nr:PP2C family serine/threonine-protein phosphatase [Dietzia cinnamea]MBM7231003.1 serine/threonine-protein phosphatase [Dietzia cinnamea]MCT2263845.1 protein phosphatase 2C domain-containing protein [Dietzia cinnamea]PWD97431.1 serine/threonine protein phosphatase [Dietzia maris]